MRRILASLLIVGLFAITSAGLMGCGGDETKPANPPATGGGTTGGTGGGAAGGGAGGAGGAGETTK